MGTSQSSKGPGSNRPIVPPWAGAAGGVGGGGASTEPSEDGSEQSPASLPAPAIAPPRRWAGTRSSLRDFARNGGNGGKAALKSYVRSGYGGSSTAARRMGSTASTASALGQALGGLGPAGGGVAGAAPIDRIATAGRSVDEIMDALVDAARPVDGSQDAEASRVAIRDSLADLLTRYEDADLLNLSDEQREFAIERFTANDIFQRFQLDVGMAVQEHAPSPTECLSRLKEIKSYIQETVAESFRRLRNDGQRMTSRNVAQVVSRAIKETFDVFEAYIA